MTDELNIPLLLPPLITDVYGSEKDMAVFERTHMAIELHGKMVYVSKSTGKDVVEYLKRASAKELGLD